MRLNDKLYDVLKWIALICIPALATFYVACAGVWGWPHDTWAAIYSSASALRKINVRSRMQSCLISSP